MSYKSKRTNPGRAVICILVLCWPLLSSHLVVAQETILWRVTDWPPFYILEGPDKGKGIYDELISMLASHFPQYNHQRISMTTPRVRLEWQKNKKLCHPSVIPGSYSTHSVVNSFLISHRIIFNKSKAHLFEEQAISLERLLSDPDFKGGITPGRYSATINALVDRYKDKKHLEKHPVYGNLIKMLLLNRLDYIIEYAVVVRYTAKKMNRENSTKSFPIKETFDKPYIDVIVGCTPNSWGEAFIRKIDAILAMEYRKPDFLEYRLRWYDEEDREMLRRQYQEYYFKDKSSLK